MVKASLEEFLRSGRLGPIQLGMGRAQVEAQVGPPDMLDHWPLRGKKPGICRYGTLEFQYTRRTDRLSQIFSDAFQPLDGGAALDLGVWRLAQGIRLTAVEADLQARQIAYRHVEAPHKDSSTVLQTAAGVQLIFVQAPNGQGLHALSYTETGDPSMRPRQLSVTLPLPVYETLRTEAMARNLSMATLCAELLIEHTRRVDP